MSLPWYHSRLFLLQANANWNCQLNCCKSGWNWKSSRGIYRTGLSNHHCLGDSSLPSIDTFTTDYTCCCKEKSITSICKTTKALVCGLCSTKLVSEHITNFYIISIKQVSYILLCSREIRHLVASVHLFWGTTNLSDYGFNCNFTPRFWI